MTDQLVCVFVVCVCVGGGGDSSEVRLCVTVRDQGYGPGGRDGYPERGVLGVGDGGVDVAVHDLGLCLGGSSGCPENCITLKGSCVCVEGGWGGCVGRGSRCCSS